MIKSDNAVVMKRILVHFLTFVCVAVSMGMPVSAVAAEDGRSGTGTNPSVRTGKSARADKSDVVWHKGEKIRIALPSDARPVLTTASRMLSSDLKKVLDARPVITEHSRGADVVVTVNPAEIKESQGFSIAISDKGCLHVTAHDSHGAAYGLLEISRLIGVSPWEWWADCVPHRKDTVLIPGNYMKKEAPSVEYRGIFINDEDWGLLPWSCRNHDKQDLGVVGPVTTSRIFELLLRLRANTYWPPMHECTVPFFLTPGNREMAERYGIYIGGSHCEPMASSTAGEWPRRGVGEYDYPANSGNIRAFWNARLKEVAGQEIIYTLGMRGVHDGAMKGASGVKQQKEVLTRVLSDQREMLRAHGLEHAPQVFIPYKEVLDIYNAGLDVLEDVTLMWCDDNYGYIRHFPDSVERSRKGGNGIYYHVSYWGRPHDYLWLGTFSPGLLYQQMGEAFYWGIDRMWILNVGDIKPAEYQIELFMDMAWNMKEVRQLGVEQHARRFLVREFGEPMASALLPVMREHYRLAYIRKPEFMGNTRTEEKDACYRQIRDLPWSEVEIRERLSAYKALSDSVEKYAAHVPEQRVDAYFQLVKYPVQAADQMNRKCLYGQLARHGKAEWIQSHAAYDSIQALTLAYNTPKWRGIMSCCPRKLEVFSRLKEVSPQSPIASPLPVIRTFNGADGKGKGTLQIYEWLGYENGAVGISEGDTLCFEFTGDMPENALLRVCMLPTHSTTDRPLSFSVRVDGKDYRHITFSTYGRSEEWKENVLRNQSVKDIPVEFGSTDAHRIWVTSDSGNIVLDQIKVIPVSELRPEP